jgi:hypothetical protein
MSGVRFTFLAKLDAPRGGGCSSERNDPPGPAIAVTTRFRARSRTFFSIAEIPIPEDPIEASDVGTGKTV